MGVTVKCGEGDVGRLAGVGGGVGGGVGVQGKI